MAWTGGAPVVVNHSFASGSVDVGDTPTLVCSVAQENDGVLVQNTGSADVYLGGVDVAASGAEAGIVLAAGAVMTVPSVAGRVHDLYAVAAAATSSTVAYLFPA
jgi:hypothetical protein